MPLSAGSIGQRRINENQTRCALRVLLSAPPWTVSAAGDESEHVSLLQLIVRGSDYEGRLVRVIGFCRLEFEGSALFLHREDFAQLITKNAVFLDTEWPVRKDWRELSDEYVVVEGIFDPKAKGHFGAYSGVLNKVQTMKRWSSRAESERRFRLELLTR